MHFNVLSNGFVYTCSTDAPTFAQCERTKSIGKLLAEDVDGDVRHFWIVKDRKLFERSANELTSECVVYLEIWDPQFELFESAGVRENVADYARILNFFSDRFVNLKRRQVFEERVARVSVTVDRRLDVSTTKHCALFPLDILMK